VTVRSAQPLSEYVAARRAEIDDALGRAVPATVVPPIIGEAMRYSLFAGGKRFRPILALSAAEAVSDGEASRVALAMPAACAIEMIHTYSLIHDDLPAMDNDTLRRGKPTLHVVHGEGMAILAGDALLAEAFALLAREPDATGVDGLTERKLATLRRIAEAAGAAGMVGGQAIDLEAVGRADDAAFDAAGLRDMHARKTGALIRASAVAGAIMAGGNGQQIAVIDRYAAALGLAFQIVDDILDVEGDPGELGKTAGKDAAAGKPTYPALFGLARSRELAAEAAADARAAAAEVGPAAGRLAEIAQWVVARSS
jgi:geranylgeranyl diphosphate synthase type II